MDISTSSMQALARQLLAAEAANQTATSLPVHEVVRVCAKLQVSVTRFAGADAFTSLLRRALALSRAEIPALQAVTVQPDGSLEDCEAFAVDAPHGGAAATEVIAHLLQLLVTFIGERFTLSLVREAWPDISSNE